MKPFDRNCPKCNRRFFAKSSFYQHQKNCQGPSSKDSNCQPLSASSQPDVDFTPHVPVDLPPALKIDTTYLNNKILSFILKLKFQFHLTEEAISFVVQFLCFIVTYFLTAFCGNSAFSLSTAIFDKLSSKYYRELKIDVSIFLLFLKHFHLILIKKIILISITFFHAFLINEIPLKFLLKKTKQLSN